MKEDKTVKLLPSPTLLILFQAASNHKSLLLKGILGE